MAKLRGKDLANLRTVSNAVDTELATLTALVGKCAEKSNGEILAGTDDLFVITGGPVLAKIFGIVSELVVGSSNLRLQHTTVAPAATAELNAGAVAVNDDAVGTAYHNIGATSVFTPVTAGAVIIDPVTTDTCEFLLPVGTVKCLGSAARAGVIKWYMIYKPLSPASVVTVAA